MYKLIIYFFLIYGLFIQFGCSKSKNEDDSIYTESLSIQVSVKQLSLNYSNNAIGTIDDIETVTVDVKEGSTFLITGQELVLTNGTYSGILAGLPAGVELTFIGYAYNSDPTEIYSNQSSPISQTLTGVDDLVSLILQPIDDGQSIRLPKIEQIQHEANITRAESSPVRFWFSGQSGDDISYSLSGVGFNFTPSTGNITIDSSSSAVTVIGTASELFGAGSYNLNLKLTNQQGNFVDVPFSIIVDNPYRLPDTNQTASFTNTSGEDSDFLLNPPLYTINGDGTVTDENTKLMWFQEDDGVTRTQVAAVDYCSSSENYGYTDWRLPSIQELKDITDYSKINSAIDETVFTNPQNGRYWSSTLHPNNTSRALYLDFSKGVNNVANNDDVTVLYYSRCVRGLPVINANLIDNGDGTITDQDARLIWQQSEGGQMDWESALNYCSNLSLGGYSWKLPNVRELESLVNHSINGNGTPKVDAVLFPNAAADYHWSSTTYNTTTKAWRVHFNNGLVTKTQKTTATLYVRCVSSID
jgi:hypothetical protein